MGRCNARHYMRSLNLNLATCDMRYCMVEFITRGWQLIVHRDSDSICVLDPNRQHLYLCPVCERASGNPNKTRSRDLIAPNP